MDSNTKHITEEEAEHLDELELLELVDEAERAIAAGHVISQEEVKHRLGFECD